MHDLTREEKETIFSEVLTTPEKSPVAARRFLRQCLDDLSQFENEPLTTDFVSYLEFKAEARNYIQAQLKKLEPYGRSA
ncbi:MAG TPA: hypothetical protein VLJ21_01850 [Candidatus Binatia bacterium]|nr:hypothetical protein [Candidatus Binatia bacterium]